MKKVVCIAALFIATATFAQPIFKGLESGMTKKEAQQEFRENKDDYTSIDVGNGFEYRIYQQNFQYQDNELVGILLTPKGSAMGQNYNEAVSFLEYSKSFFDSLNYSEFFVPEFWNAPVNFGAKYGLLMHNPEKTVMLQLYPTSYMVGNTRSYLVKLHLYKYDQFLEWYETEKAKQEDLADKSGF